MSWALAVAGSFAIAQPNPNRVMGVVTEVTAGKKQLAIRADEGPIYGAMLSDGANVLRIDPAERDMSKAEKVDFTAIAAGDRVLVRGEVNAENKTVIVRTLVLMSKSALSAREKKEADAWKTQSLAGVVKKVDPASRTVLLTARAGGPPAGPGAMAGQTVSATKEWTVAVAPEVSMMRYADGSAKYADAKPSSLEAVKEGDQLRVRGPRNAEEATVKAEAIVFGSFRTVAGEIKSVDAGKNQITVMDLQTKKPLVIDIGAEATLRKMPSFGGGGRPGGGPPGGGGGFGGGRPGGGAPDLQRMMDRMPPAQFSDLQKGDAVILSVAQNKAITVIAGVDALLRASPTALGQMVAGWSLDMGMPQ